MATAPDLTDDGTAADSEPEKLTALEVDVLTTSAIGLSQDQAALHLGVSPRTFRRVLTSAADKLNATGPVHAVVLAALGGHLDADRVRTQTAPPRSAPTPTQVRAWAAAAGVLCPPRGKIPACVYAEYEAAALGAHRKGLRL
ncbi:LuxR C-terminal-related transcriptional regulator [Actinomadura sp. WMMA1423]|uniref:Lsr2 family DNA-binding protein n=1 Tax=Actinomadura sp. WMMA1423 TaxID=2591108 RepID=UPI00197AFEF9|nr:LuxR C-terminal-related transcriptional regulator [Actinomadura sp. WMMA1423]